MAKRKETTEVAKSKTVCPLSTEEFQKQSQPINVQVGSAVLIFTPRVFSSGKFGWGCYEKSSMKVGEQTVKVQASVNLVVLGSGG